MSTNKNMLGMQKSEETFSLFRKYTTVHHGPCGIWFLDMVMMRDGGGVGTKFHLFCHGISISTCRGYNLRYLDLQI
jgi:hypothetical protein